ncbi:MAG TPA: cation diffusion facilitator family transporter [Vicinamibacterales bacterium]|nr:cation diffusion facilitator family transporter [Vicinamibacterales bacterium]
MADTDRASLLTHDSRYREVRRVLLRILSLNIAVALAKIVFGQLSGSISILSDGFHSLTDGASNVVALVGLRLANKPPDANHPYGHRKFETLAAAAIALFLLVIVIEIAQAAFVRLRSGGAPAVTATSFIIMFATLAINMAVVRFERHAARRLSSELLMADARHTQSDVVTSLAVIAALMGSANGYAILDPLAAVVIIGFIGYAGLTIARDATKILSDAIVISEEDVQRIVQGVPTVLGCHRIRSRGSADHVFLDLHVWLDGATPLTQAHAVSHQVKDMLMERYPQIADAIIHIEPPPKGGG